MSEPKIRLATVWLDGCSGCHMSLLDLDEGLLELAERFELSASPLVDAKRFPGEVDVTLVEGAVSSTADREKLVAVRACSRILVSLGDCAITANVPAMRNRFPVEEVLGRAYGENADAAGAGAIDRRRLPVLFSTVRPVHEFVPVDIFLPGCPPPSGAIGHLLAELLAGRLPDMSGRSRFGA